jgi:predicted NBD/HSP70 family sugar kinase
VLATTRRTGTAFRDVLADATGFSLATVNRQVSVPIEDGLLHERPDLAPAGTVGRPRIPVEVDLTGSMVIGLHVGLSRTTLAVGDLRGHLLGAVDVPTPEGDPDGAVAVLAHRLRRLAARWPERRILQAAVVVGGRLSADRTVLRHPRLGWADVPVAALVDRAVGADVVVVPQAEAIVEAENVLAPRSTAGSTLFVYARDAVAAVLAVDGAVHTPAGGPGTVSHLPVGGDVTCHCGATGCLEAVAGDTAVATAAHLAGLVAEPTIARVIAAAEGGSQAAHDLLAEPGRQLGRGVALVRDVLNPDQVVLVGQAFTAYRPALSAVSAGFAATSVLDPMALQVSALGPGLQALAVCCAAPRPVYTDPLAAVRRAGARAAESCPSSAPTRKGAMTFLVLGFLLIVQGPGTRRRQA